jgi:predicted nucleotidyltransferase
MKVPAPSLMPILRSDAQGRILARVLTDPDAAYSLSDLVAWSKTSMPTVQREIERAEQAGVVTTEKIGPTRLVRANTAHPLYDELRRIILATYGPPAVIADEFEQVAAAEAVVLFGSWAARYAGRPGRAPNDIDVLVIGDVDRDVVDDAAERAERRIGVPVQATVRTLRQWRSDRESFIKEVRSRPIAVVLVADDESSLARELLELEPHEAARS